MTAPLPDFNILRVKDFITMMRIGETKAKQYYKDIKEHFGITDVMGIHYKKYFKIPS